MVQTEVEQDIPIIDIGPLVQNFPIEDKLRVARQINGACREFGFFYVSNHGVSRQLEDDLEMLSREFFTRPLEEKEEIAMAKGGQAWRGYFPLGLEKTSGKPDMKEGVFFGAELDNEHPLVTSGTPLHGPNLFPRNPPTLQETILTWIRALTRLGHQIMGGIALSLGLEENYFDRYFKTDPLTLFQIFHYPTLKQEEVGETWGVGEHTDYGVLTILKQDLSGGLEVKTKTGGKWIAAPPVEGTFVCNIGDMLDRMTGGLYRSTPHRVRSPLVNPDKPRRGRVSFPFFFDPAFGAQVEMINELKMLGRIDEIEEDRLFRWDKSSVHQVQGTYGEYYLKKVANAFPGLRLNSQITDS